jgi:hypothetical protein
MRHFLVMAAAAAAFAASMAVPANAAENWGPSKVSNQCFTAAPFVGRELYYGSWSSCPQQASATAVAPTVKKKKSSR